MKDLVLGFLEEKAEQGAVWKELTDKFGAKGLMKSLDDLELEGKIFRHKNGSSTIYKSLNYRGEGEGVVAVTEQKSSENPTLGNELQNLLVDTIAKYSVDKIAQSLFPVLKKKCVEEFGMEPVVHEIKIGDKPASTSHQTLPPCFDSIVAYAVNGNPVMLTGPAGTGKGYISRNVAKVTGAQFFEVNAVKNSYDLTGFVDANSRFVRTPFYDACKAVSEGQKAVFLFDEMDCSEPEVLKIFNEALSSKEFTFPNDEHLEFEDLIILCACNTYGTGSDEQYCGEQLDASTLDRFVMVKVDYNRKVELAVANGDEDLVDFIDAFRRQCDKNGLNFVVSYRSIKRIASMKGILPLKQVMKECLVKSMAEDDLQNILMNMNESIKENIFYKATNGENVKIEVSQPAQGDLFVA